jgi:hypothetical protein
VSWRDRLPFNPLYLVALIAAILWAFPKVLARAALPVEPLAWTECPFFGEPRVTISSTVSPADSLPVRRHEEVHAAQCRELGALRYRARNLTVRGRLSLEAPGYCAGARARLAQGEDSARVRERLHDDAAAAFVGDIGADTVRAALRSACAGVAE